MVITWLDIGEVLLDTFILANFLLKFGCYFSRSNTFLVISKEWLVWLMWDEMEVNRLDTGHNMWHWPLTSPMTFTLDVARSNFVIALSQELLVWLMWNETKWVNMILDRLYDLALRPHPGPWHWGWNFKVKVWNSCISGIGWPIDMERKGCELSIHGHEID